LVGYALVNLSGKYELKLLNSKHRYNRKIMSKHKKWLTLGKTLYDILSAIKAEGSPVPFSYKPYFVSHRIAEYYKVAKIKGANLHSLRKTFGSRLIQEKKADLYATLVSCHACNDV